MAPGHGARRIASTPLYLPISPYISLYLPISPQARAASRVSARSFLVFALPVLTLIVGKISAFGFMTHAAAGLGRVPLATHQARRTHQPRP